MDKKKPWWKKPFDKENEKDTNEDYNDKPEYNDDERNATHSRSRRSKDRFYGHRQNDWERDLLRRGMSPVDDEFGSIFSESPFRFRDSLFSDIEHEFSEMHLRMDKLFKDTAEGKLQPGEGGPFVYGFSMRTGPDGIPHIQEFGNMPPEMRRNFRGPRGLPFTAKGEFDKINKSDRSTDTQGEIKREVESLGNTRKPLTDVLECDDHISITMELPGVEKNDINLEIIENELEVNVDTSVRNYYNKLPLPSEVDPKSISANFKNGVLEVCVKHLKPQKKKGKKININ